MEAMRHKHESNPDSKQIIQTVVEDSSHKHKRL